jgi:hypothetical protein
MDRESEIYAMIICNASSLGHAIGGGMQLKVGMSLRQLTRTCTLAVVLTLSIANVAMATGLPSAGNYFLFVGPDYGFNFDSVHKYVNFTFTIINWNSRDVFIRGIGQNGPGLLHLVSSGSGMHSKLVIPSGLGKTLKVLPNKSIGVSLWYQITDCAKVPDGDGPLALDVSLRSGKWQRVGLEMPGYPPTQWQKSMANSVCP